MWKKGKIPVAAGERKGSFRLEKNKMRKAEKLLVGGIPLFGKGIRKMITGMVLSLLLVFLPGCSARSAISPDSFQSSAESAGFTVTEEDASSQGAQVYYSAQKDDIDVVYLEYESSSEAQNAYSTLKKSVETAGASVIVESDAFCKYTVTNGEIYHAIIRSGSTLVYGKTPASGQEVLDQLIQALDY